MSVINFISQHFYSAQRLPRSLKVMRIIAIIGIALGTATLLLSLGIATGFRQAYQRSILDFNAHVVILKAGEISSIMDDLEQVEDALPVEDVAGSTPFLYREGLAVSKGGINGVVIKGVDPASIQDVNKMKIILPESLDLDQALNLKAKIPSVILGRALAEKLQLAMGDILTLMVPRHGEKHAAIELKVKGFFESGLYDYDQTFALMHIEAAQKVFQTKEVQATGIELKLIDPDLAQKIAAILTKALPAGYDILTWQELNRDLFEALSLEKLVFSIIMGALVVVAAFNIIGVIVLLVYFRTHEVAILRALGVNCKKLIKIFIQGGVKIGLFGTVYGIILGLIVSFLLKKFNLIHLEPEIYFLQRLPIDISWLMCAMIASFCLIICWLVSWLGSRWIVEIPISEALKSSR
ncbi:MAG: ABC transporter permease [Pseudomonadota bacterium]